MGKIIESLIQSIEIFMKLLFLLRIQTILRM